MATDSIMGLFQTPEQYQLAQQQAQMEQARAYAAQDPMQRAVASQYFAGGQLGRALGGEDPMLKMASARQQILRGVNPQDMKSIEEAAVKFSRMGDGQGVQAMQELAFKQSQVARNLREAKTADQRNYETALEQGYRGTLQDFILEQKKAGASKTNIGITQKQEEAVTKSNVEAFGALRDEAINAGKTIEAVQAIKPLINRAFTGFASNTKLSAGQIADTFGIPVEGTTETERLRSIQNNLKIGNSTVLKGAISDKDMAILGEAIGQGNTTAGGIRGIIEDLEKNALISQSKYQKANRFQQEGRISQYDFVEGDKAARSEVNTKLQRLKELERKAAQGGK